MSLPKINIPTFELKQPSTGLSIQYRPFLVKEEKILLTARESDDVVDHLRAVRQIINNRVLSEGFNIDDVPIFDMEYIFVKIRASSIGGIVDFVVNDSTDGKRYELKLNLDEIEVQIDPEHNKKIEVTDNIGMVMKYATPKIAEKVAGVTERTDLLFRTVMECIDYVYDENEVYPWNESTIEEKLEFIDSLPVESYDAIEKFFDTVPRIEHLVSYTNSNDEVKNVVFRNVEDFFYLA
jgi:hypothetical protein